MQQIYRQSFVLRADLRANPQVLFLFGDNEFRSGFGGQAKEMRGEPNAIGVRTKRRPGLAPEDFWSDGEYPRVTLLIEEDLYIVRTHLKAGNNIVIPLDGIGTGMSRLSLGAPKIFQFLQHHLVNLRYYCVSR